MLNCAAPIYAPILRHDVLPSGATFRIPAGLLGGECEFGFLMGRDFPGSDQTLAMKDLRSAAVECFAALELVGRRVTAAVRLNEVSSIADFSLDVAVVRGPPIPDWPPRNLAALPVRAVLDGATVAKGTGARVLGNPLNALPVVSHGMGRTGRPAPRRGDRSDGHMHGHHKSRSRTGISGLFRRSPAGRSAPRLTSAHDWRSRSKAS